MRKHSKWQEVISEQLSMLHKLTEIKTKDINIDNPEILSLFSSTEALGITPKHIGGFSIGTLGLYGFDSQWTKSIIEACNPKSLTDLIRITALSRGAGVWQENGELLICEGKDLSDIICTRDDIKLYLLSHGMEQKKVYEILLNVRKGKGLTSDMEEAMLDANVPTWYIESCKKIEYIITEEQAAKYVDSALRLAYYKIYYPKEFYKAWLLCLCNESELRYLSQGEEHLQLLIDRTEKKLRDVGEDWCETRDKLYKMYVAREMYARGFLFK